MEIRKKCACADLCGGCSLQGMNYLKQLEKKQKTCEDLLSKIHPLEKIIGMENPYNYRNKVQVSFGYDDRHQVVCGNYIVSTHIIVPVDDCQISDEKANRIIQSIEKLEKKYKISIFDERALKGCLRHVLIRTSSLDEIMVVLVTGSQTFYKKEEFLKDLLKYNPDITTVVQNINNKRTSMVLGNRNIIWFGKGNITDRLCGCDFRISPESFYQINRTQTEVLYNKAIEACNLNGNETVIDAYCGTGTIGIVAAKKAGKVLGVEINESSIRDAMKNATNNHITNIEFECADAGDYMVKLAKSTQKTDVVIMDPPRAGASIKFLDALATLRPKKVVYVSCNPVTLKDNLNYLIKKGYEVKSIQPVDMFPFTEHVECIALICRK